MTGAFTSTRSVITSDAGDTVGGVVVGNDDARRLCSSMLRRLLERDPLRDRGFSEPWR